VVSDSGTTTEAVDSAKNAAMATRWKRWVETPTRKAIAIAGGIAVLIGLVAGSIELYEKLFPPPPPVLVTIVPETLVEPDVTWARAVAKIPGLGQGTYTSQQLAEIGAVFTVDLEVEGQEDQTGVLSWRTLDRDGGELAVPAWIPASVSVRPTSDDAQLTQKVWARLPRGVEAFRLEFAYADDDGVTRDTEPGPLVRLGIG
jgi:hypothetical protein